MADFDKFYPGLLAAEGGYVHDLQDAGGETYKGIARNYNGQWTGWLIVDDVKYNQLKLPRGKRVEPINYPTLNKALAKQAALQENIKAFYKGAYWNSLGLDFIKNQSLAEQLADHGVNAGVGRVPRMLQYCLQLMGCQITEDGKLGVKTLAAINEVDQAVLFQTFSALRIACYRYRAATLPEADAGKHLGEQFGTSSPELKSLFNRLKITPNITQSKFLVSWISRVRAIKFAA